MVEAVLAPVLDVLEPGSLSEIDGGSEYQLRAVMREYIKPYYASFDPHSREVIDDSVLYLAKFSPAHPVVPLDALPTPFEIRQELPVFCQWLAEELGLRDRHMDPEDFEYSNDLSIVHRLRRKPPS